ncbi:MAG: asparaginase [Acidobacteriota bacterium]
MNTPLLPVAPILVEVTRGGLVESRHRGMIAACSIDATSVISHGDTSLRTYLRSAAKPFQAIPLLVSGAAARFQFSRQELAMITASHSGEVIHTELVLAILRKIGLDESALLCGAHEPFDEGTAREIHREGIPVSPVHNNCSGKHAGMLALARHLDASFSDYISPTHPVQVLIRETLASFAGCSAESIDLAVDGCSAPVFALSLDEMARSYANLVASEYSLLNGELRSAAAEVVEAMAEFPRLVGGTTGRLDTELMNATGGAIISKVGAEGVQLLGVRPCERFPHGLGVAIKIEDGDSRRARDPVVIETLRQLGLLDEGQLRKLADYTRPVLRNHRGIEVGEVRACFSLALAETPAVGTMLA